MRFKLLLSHRAVSWTHLCSSLHLPFSAIQSQGPNNQDLDQVPSIGVFHPACRRFPRQDVVEGQTANTAQTAEILPLQLPKRDTKIFYLCKAIWLICFHVSYWVTSCLGAKRLPLCLDVVVYSTTGFQEDSSLSRKLLCCPKWRCHRLTGPVNGKWWHCVCTPGAINSRCIGCPSK